MRHPLILEEIGRHQWAVTSEAMNAILRAVEGVGLTPADQPIFHLALEEIEANLPNGEEPVEYNHGQRVGNVGVVRVEGPIVPRVQPFMQASGMTSSAGLESDIAKMDADPTIEKILMVFDSPGGAVTGTSELAARIRAVTKPIESYVYGMAASAAYWLASATGKITAADTAMVGSIGTVLTVGVDKAEDRVKIISSQSPLKNPDVTKDEGRAYYQEMADAMSDIFVAAVAENRRTTVDNVLANFGRGGIMIASKAKERGMIDGIAMFRDYFRDYQSEAVQPKMLDTDPSLGVKMESTDVEDFHQEETMDFEKMLAENPEFAAYVTAREEAVRKDLRAELGLAADVAVSAKYPDSVRRIAAEVIKGARVQAALDGAMAAVEVAAESKASEQAKQVASATPQTPAQQPPTVSADGSITTEDDFQAAIVRAKARR